MKHLFTVLLLAVLSGCDTLTTLKTDTKVLESSAINTVLIIDETFEYDGSVLPQGIYYPDSASTGGSVNYLFNQPIQVKVLWLERTCMGGLSIFAEDPYNEYRIFYYGCGNPVTIINIPKKVNFRIVDRKTVRMESINIKPPL